MIYEIDVLRDQFRECAAQLDSVSLPAARELAFTEEMLEKVQAEMIAAYVARTAAYLHCSSGIQRAPPPPTFWHALCAAAQHLPS